MCQDTKESIEAEAILVSSVKQVAIWIETISGGFKRYCVCPQQRGR